MNHSTSWVRSAVSEVSEASLTRTRARCHHCEGHLPWVVMARTVGDRNRENTSRVFIAVSLCGHV